VVSVLFFVVYYVIDISAMKFVRELVIPPMPGIWISSLILMPMGIFLTYKATTDSVIMNTETYFNFYKKTAGFFIRLLRQNISKFRAGYEYTADK
jgi:lipopolysaccharide export system permease protein